MVAMTGEGSGVRAGSEPSDGNGRSLPLGNRASPPPFRSARLGTIPIARKARIGAPGLPTRSPRAREPPQLRRGQRDHAAPGPPLTGIVRDGEKETAHQARWWHLCREEGLNS